MTMIYIVIVSMVFCKHRSCVTQLLHVVEDLSDMFDNGDPFDIIYLDLKKRLISSYIKHWS